MPEQLLNKEFANHPVIKLIDDNTNNKAEALRKLVESGTDLLIKDKNGSNIIHHLIYQIEFESDQSKKQELYDMLSSVIESDKSLVYEEDGNRMTPIAKAVEFGNVSLTEILLKHGANPNVYIGRNTKIQNKQKNNETIIIDYNAPSILLDAIDNDNIRMVKLLLQQKDLNVEPEAAVKLFALRKENPELYQDFRKIYQKNEPEVKNLFLRDAISKDIIINDKILKIYGSKEIEVTLDNRNLEYNRSYKAIQEFFRKNKSDGDKLLEIILNDKINPDSKIEQVKQLIADNPDVWLNVQNKNDETALMKAVEKGNTEIVKALIDKGADLNIKNGNGKTALFLAVEDRNIKIVEILVQNGASLDIQSDCYFSKGYTPLMHAIENRNAEMAKILIDNGASVNIMNTYGKTALTLAIQNRDIERVKMLIDNGANINIKNKNAYTALMFAAEQENVEIAEILIENGANINSENKYKKTALMFAREKVHTKIVEIIRETIETEKKIEEKTDNKIIEAFELILKESNIDEALSKLSADKKFSKYIKLDDEKQKDLIKTQIEKIKASEAKLENIEGTKADSKKNDTLEFEKIKDDILKTMKESEGQRMLNKSNVLNKNKKTR